MPMDDKEKAALDNLLKAGKEWWFHTQSGTGGPIEERERRRKFIEAIERYADTGTG